MWAKASIFRIGPFWPPRRTRALVVDDGRVPTLDEPAVIDEALALGDKLGEALAPRRYRPCCRPGEVNAAADLLETTSRSKRWQCCSSTGASVTRSR
jgi:hypothetical protein